MAATKSPETQVEPVQVARVGESLLALRVVGRGTFHNSVGLKQLFDRQMASDPASEFILDLAECTSMDSTFMGLLAGVGLTQRDSGQGRLVIVNLTEHTSKLLRMLGLTHFLDVREPGADPLPPEAEFERVEESAPMSRIERIRLMIEAHRHLIDVDQGNEVKFQGVLTYLSESLGRSESAAT